MIRMNLNMVFYTHVEPSPTKTVYIKYYTKAKTKQKTHYKHTHTRTHARLQARTHAHTVTVAETAGDMTCLLYGGVGWGGKSW